MKFFLMISLCWPLALVAQDIYYVSHIQGVVKKKGQKAPLRIGQEVHLTDSLSYDKQDSYLSVCSPVKGNYILRRNKQSPAAQQSEFFLAIKDVLAPATKTVSLGVRSGVLNTLFDLENYLRTFSAQSPMLVVDRCRIVLNVARFDQRAERFFYISYQYQQEEINKKLSFNQPVSARDTLFLLIDKTLFEVDGKAIDPLAPDSLALYYRVDPENKNTFVAPVHIRYCTSEALLPELQVLYDTFNQLYAGKSDKNTLVASELRDHLVAHWGRVDEETFRWLYLQVKRHSNKQI